jgi:HEAT repeat protein
MTHVTLPLIRFWLEIFETNNQRRLKMKALKNTNRTLSVVLLLIVFLLSTAAIAQKQSIDNVTTNEHAIKNLIAGIQSENNGVKRSSIYFAGKYRIAEVENVLIKQLKKEKDASTRILIALVLYEMGSTEGLLAVQQLAQNDDKVRVRRMATHIFTEYLVNDENSSASLIK